MVVEITTRQKHYGHCGISLRHLVEKMGKLYHYTKEVDTVKDYLTLERFEREG